MHWVKIFNSKPDALARLPVRKPQLLIIGSTRICLIVEGESLFAIEDRCPHNGESLSKGSITGFCEVVCPWHGQRFNYKTGRECAERSRDLVTYPVREDADGVYLGM
jgi:nitrite reductase/ring-hydroxylating ferredoxin subunit